MADFGNLVGSIEGFSNIDVLSVLSDFDEGVIIADRNGKILFYNDAQAQIDDLAARDVVGQNVLDLYNVDAEQSKIFRCIRSGRPIRGGIVFLPNPTGQGGQYDPQRVSPHAGRAGGRSRLFHQRLQHAGEGRHLVINHWGRPRNRAAQSG